MTCWLCGRNSENGFEWKWSGDHWKDKVGTLSYTNDDIFQIGWRSCLDWADTFSYKRRSDRSLKSDPIRIVFALRRSVFCVPRTRRKFKSETNESIRWQEQLESYWLSLWFLAPVGLARIVKLTRCQRDKDWMSFWMKILISPIRGCLLTTTTSSRECHLEVIFRILCSFNQNFNWIPFCIDWRINMRVFPFKGYANPYEGRVPLNRRPAASGYFAKSEYSNTLLNLTICVVSIA